MATKTCALRFRRTLVAALAATFLAAALPAAGLADPTTPPPAPADGGGTGGP